ncbi:MAG: hypothetical protein ACRDNR_17445 [Gaiellaceae bacterium]
MTSAEQYVTAAYLVVLAVVLLHVVLYAFKLVRLEREVVALSLTRGKQGEDDEDRARADS